MARPLRQVRNAVLEQIASSPRVFCFLDYDGTLAPIAPTPEDAAPLPGAVELLRQMVAEPGIDIAIVTGRPIADVRRFLDIAGIFYVGVHGLEVLLPSGEYATVEGVALVRSTLPAIRREIEHAMNGAPGFLIENKGAALACHYRLAAPEDGARVRAALERLVRTYRRRGVPIVLVYGHEVAEVRPLHVNKGKTVCALLAAHAPEALPLYIGDDSTDEDAFKLLPPRAVTIRVGPQETPTRARYLAESPDEVLDFLRAIRDAHCGSSSPVLTDRTSPGSHE